MDNMYIREQLVHPPCRSHGSYVMGCGPAAMWCHMCDGTWRGEVGVVMQPCGTCVVASMHMYMCGGVHAHVHVWWRPCTCTCVVASMHMHMCGGVHAHAHVWWRPCTCTCVVVKRCVNVHSHNKIIYTSCHGEYILEMHTHTHTRMYMHTHTYTSHTFLLVSNFDLFRFPQTSFKASNISNDSTLNFSDSSSARSMTSFSFGEPSWGREGGRDKVHETNHCQMSCMCLTHHR